MTIGKNIGKVIPMKVSSMEPMMPRVTPELISLSGAIRERIGGLKEKLHPITAKAVSAVVAGMNSYYSNLIEGHHTYPKDIERALQNDFSSNPQERNKQLLGLAHVKTENAILSYATEENIFTPGTLLKIHETFYANLPESMRLSKSQSGKEYQIIPGKFRNFEVAVGAHQPLASKSLEKFIARFCEAYKNIPIGEILIVAAASHHRLAWIHPFGDGNGRVVRIFTSSLLKAYGLNGGGIWSISRGLARNRSQYYAKLAIADQDRQGDLDGRGTLSERSLIEFCEFFLSTMLDQMDFMLGILKLDSVISRYARLMHEVFPKKSELCLRIIKELWTFGETPRGKICEITGMSERASRAILSELESKGFVKSDSLKTPVHINISADISEQIFPNLFIG